MMLFLLKNRGPKPQTHFYSKWSHINIVARKAKLSSHSQQSANINLYYRFQMQAHMITGSKLHWPEPDSVVDQEMTALRIYLQRCKAIHTPLAIRNKFTLVSVLDQELAALSFWTRSHTEICTCPGTTIFQMTARCETRTPRHSPLGTTNLPNTYQRHPNSK
jgi:hypothetical protein